VRTTLTIDEDVEALLKQRLRTSGEPLKQAVNKYLRLGMQAEQSAPPKKPFKVKPVSFEMPKAMRETNKVSDWLEYLDGLDWSKTR